MTRLMIEVLKGATSTPPPIWMMRQAGRYLPEYRAKRKEAGSFLDLCYNPDFAVEVTLQPIRRFGFDASILFSDILVVPHALKRELWFEEGRGPILVPITKEEIADLDASNFHEHLEPVYETVRRLRSELPNETTLIGFCGAPWTIATYMIAGHGTPDQAPAKIFGYSEPEAMDQLLSTIAKYSAEYLCRQVEAGADVLQIFDSWSGVLDQASFERWCVKPVKEMIAAVRAKHPNVPIIGFPKGAGLFLDTYRQDTGIDGLGLDWTVPFSQARRLQAEGAIQGNLDPLRLIAGGDALRDGVNRILEELGQGPLIFNLGHGIRPQTPIAHVEEMVRLVRDFKA